MNAAVRPVEAAGLVLIRQARDARVGVEALLGRRSRSAGFMPGVYVFPGGRVSAADRRPSGFAETLLPAPLGLDDGTRRRLVVFARAALRETFEETGLLLGAPAGAPAHPSPATGCAPDDWAAFAHADLIPAFGALRLIARAITPTGSLLRFHTRFFLGAGTSARGSLGGDGELEDIRWVPVTAAASLPMPVVTALVLDEALAHRDSGAKNPRPAALFRWIGRQARPCYRRGMAGSAGLTYSARPLSCQAPLPAPKIDT